MIPYRELQNGPRVDLAAAIPLPAPMAMFLEPTNVCNFRCPVCPESLSDYRAQAGYYQAMPERIWRAVYSQIWSRLKVLRFYDEGEPLLNNRLPDMIETAYLAHVADRLELTTNGSLLDIGWCRALVGSQLDYIRVSVYGTTDEDYRKATGSRFTPADVIRGVRMLREARDKAGRGPHIYAHLVSQHPDAEIFAAQYGHIADEIGIEKNLHNWGGSDDRLVHLGKPGNSGKPANSGFSRRVCAKPFYEVTVHANGDVSACCADWSGKLHLGNIERESLLDIWHGQKLRAIQAAHLAGERERLNPCNGCTLIHNQVDDLDALINLKLLKFV